MQLPRSIFIGGRTITTFEELDIFLRDQRHKLPLDDYKLLRRETVGQLASVAAQFDNVISETYRYLRDQNDWDSCEESMEIWTPLANRASRAEAYKLARNDTMDNIRKAWGNRADEVMFDLDLESPSLSLMSRIAW